MTNFVDDDDDDDLNDDLDNNEEPAVAGAGAGTGAATGPNRNFMLALGVLGAIFVLMIIVLAILFLSRRSPGVGNSSISQTNAVILISNTQTAGAATQTRAFMLTPSATPTMTDTPVAPTATHTQVVALATATSAVGSGQIITITPNLQTLTATIGAALTQSVQQTQTKTAQSNVTGTATNLPKTGFAEDVGLPGLFGLALGLLVVIILARRLRLSSNQ